MTTTAATPLLVDGLNLIKVVIMIVGERHMWHYSPLFLTTILLLLPRIGLDILLLCLRVRCCILLLPDRPSSPGKIPLRDARRRALGGADNHTRCAFLLIDPQRGSLLPGDLNPALFFRHDLRRHHLA